MSRLSRRWLVPVLVLVVSVTGACRPGGGNKAGSGPRQTTGQNGASPSAAPAAQAAPRVEAPTTDYLADRSLYLPSRREPVQLGVPPHPALQGTLAPLVVPSPDGASLAYTVFDQAVVLDPDRTLSQQGVNPGDALGTPAILLHDLATGAEQPLAHGAYSPAWRGDGALAFVAGSDPTLRAATAYMGHVMVMPAGVSAEAAERWTPSEGRYVVAGWAGPRLLVYHTTDSESFDLEVLDGPGEVRTLAPASSLVALSPDGARAAVATSPNGWSSTVQILDIATGSLLASLPMAARTSLVYSGSWIGSRLVARGGDDKGPLVAVFAVGPDSLRLEKVLRVDPSLPNGLAEPRLDPQSPDRLSAWSYVPGTGGKGTYVLVGCDLATLRCANGPPITAKVVRLHAGPGL